MELKLGIVNTDISELFQGRAKISTQNYEWALSNNETKTQFTRMRNSRLPKIILYGERIDCKKFLKA